VISDPRRQSLFQHASSTCVPVFTGRKSSGSDAKGVSFGGRDSIYTRMRLMRGGDGSLQHNPAMQNYLHRVDQWSGPNSPRTRSLNRSSISRARQSQSHSGWYFTSVGHTRLAHGETVWESRAALLSTYSHRPTLMLVVTCFPCSFSVFRRGEAFFQHPLSLHRLLRLSAEFSPSLSPTL
jgi:hypothetical protein